MELWDGYNADRTLAGVDISREDEEAGKFPKGLYHAVADIVVRHTDGTYLVMQRDYNKKGFPGEWEIGACGSVLKGESPYEGALRELHEETGISAEGLIHLKNITVVHCNGVGVHYYMYLCITDMDKDAVTLQYGETIDFRWITAEELLSGSYLTQRSMDAVQKLERMEYIPTERLLLRPLEMSDLELVHWYASDKENTRYMMNLPNTEIGESENFIRDAIAQWESESPEYYEYAVILDGVQIGGVCLYLTEDKKQGELGWILDSRYHHKGYAAEAAKAVVGLAQALGLECVFARCDGRNKPSEQLMKRLGMTLENDSGTRYYEKRGESAPELKYSMSIKGDV